MPRCDGPHPGVLVVHGGAWAMGTRAQLSGVAQILAKHGFTAVAISYRLAPTHKFPAQIEDCKAAVRWMRTEAADLKIDPTRIGGFGYSAGAHLVALLGHDATRGRFGRGRRPDEAAEHAAAGGGRRRHAVRFPRDARRLKGFWLSGSAARRREVPEQYRLASPAAFVSADDPPMFFFHGERDELVPLVSPKACATP